MRRVDNNEHLKELERKRLLARDTIVHLTHQEVSAMNGDIDYDIDWRWDTVAAMTVINRDGKDWRVTVEEVIGE